MKVDGEKLRRLREMKIGNMRNFSKLSGLATDTITAIENSFETVRITSLKRYCDCLKVSYLNYVLEKIPGPNELFKIGMPNKVDFRMSKRPSNERNDWRYSQIIVSLLPFDIGLHELAQSKTRLEKVTIKIQAFETYFNKSTIFDWSNWVSFDSARNTSLVSTLGHEQAWRGEINRGSEGSQVRPREFNPGSQDTHELLFRSAGPPSWSSFVDRYRTSQEGSLEIEICVHYTYPDLGKRTLNKQKKIIRLREKCISSLVEKGFQEGKFGYPSYIEPVVIGGDNEKCGFECCCNN